MQKLSSAAKLEISFMQGQQRPNRPPKLFGF